MYDLYDLYVLSLCVLKIHSMEADCVLSRQNCLYVRYSRCRLDNLCHELFVCRPSTDSGKEVNEQIKKKRGSKFSIFFFFFLTVSCDGSTQTRQQQVSRLGTLLSYFVYDSGCSTWGWLLKPQLCPRAVLL